MPAAKRKPVYKPEWTMADYLRPSLQALYPPRTSEAPKELAARLRRLRRLRFIIGNDGGHV
jgi:hypothetical protein